MDFACKSRLRQAASGRSQVELLQVVALPASH